MAADASGVFIENSKGQVAAPGATKGQAEAALEVIGDLIGAGADAQITCSSNGEC